jgi:hypothetical protein
MHGEKYGNERHHASLRRNLHTKDSQIDTHHSRRHIQLVGGWLWWNPLLWYLVNVLVFILSSIRLLLGWQRLIKCVLPPVVVVIEDAADHAIYTPPIGQIEPVLEWPRVLQLRLILRML